MDVSGLRRRDLYSERFWPCMLLVVGRAGAGLLVASKKGEGQQLISRGLRSVGGASEYDTYVLQLGEDGWYLFLRVGSFPAVSIFTDLSTLANSSDLEIEISQHQAPS